jgi:hypothetical protein
MVFYQRLLFRETDQPKVFSVIISLKGSNTGYKLDKYIDVISPYQIHHYIMHRDKETSETAVDKFVKIISRTY